MTDPVFDARLGVLGVSPGQGISLNMQTLAARISARCGK